MQRYKIFFNLPNYFKNCLYSIYLLFLCMDYMKKEYFKMMGDKILLSQEDLTINEKTLIEFSYFLFTEKLEEIKLLNDENRRISIELSNLKTYLEDLNSDIREDN